MKEIIETLTLGLTFGSLGYLVQSAYPVQLFVSWIGHLINTNKSKRKLVQFAKMAYPLLDKLFQCAGCFTFWFALIPLMDIGTAALAAVVAKHLEKYFNNHKL